MRKRHLLLLFIVIHTLIFAAPNAELLPTPDIKSLHTLYRVNLPKGAIILGGQPDQTAFAKLQKKYGIQSVVNLRVSGPRFDEQKVVFASRIPYYLNLPIKLANFNMKSTNELQTFLNNPAHFPVYMHSKNGNRAALILALYYNNLSPNGFTQAQLTKLAQRYGLEKSMISNPLYLAILATASS